MASNPGPLEIGVRVTRVSNARRLQNVDRQDAVALLSGRDSRRLCGGGHLLVAVEDDLRPERRVSGHLDRQISPLGVPDVK